MSELGPPGLLAEPLARGGRRPAPGRRRRRTGARPRDPTRRAARGDVAATSPPRPWSCCATPARRTCCATPVAPTRSRGSSGSTPRSLEPIERSPDLAGGPTWPGGTRRARATARCTSRSATTCTGSRPDTSADRDPHAPPRPPVQQLRRPARRSPRHEGLRWRRSPVAPSPSPEPTELLVLEPEAAGDRRPARAARSARSRASPRTATTSTSSATSTLFRVRWDGRTARARRRASDRGTGRSTGRPTGGTRSSTRARRGSSTTARAASATRGRSATRASRPHRCTSCAVDLADGCGAAHRDLRAPERRRRQPARRRPGAADRGRLRQRQRRARRVRRSTADGALVAPLVPGAGPRVPHDPLPRHRRARDRRLRPGAHGRPGGRPRHRDRHRARAGRHRGARCSRWSSRASASTATSTSARSPR